MLTLISILSFILAHSHVYAQTRSHTWPHPHACPPLLTVSQMECCAWKAASSRRWIAHIDIHIQTHTHAQMYVQTYKLSDTNAHAYTDIHTMAQSRMYWIIHNRLLSQSDLLAHLWPPSQPIKSLCSSLAALSANQIPLLIFSRPLSQSNLCSGQLGSTSVGWVRENSIDLIACDMGQNSGCMSMRW